MVSDNETITRGAVPDDAISIDVAVAVITAMSAVALLAVSIGANFLSSEAGLALMGAAIATPIPGDTAVVGAYMLNWMGKPPLAPRPKAYMTKAVVGL